MFFRIVTALALLLAIALPPAGRAGDVLSAEAEQALAALRQRTALIASLACSFTQETDIPLFAAPVVSRGSLRFSRPDTLAWEYSEPLAEGFVLTGGTGYRWQGTREERTPFVTSRDPVAGLVGHQVMSWIRFDREWIDSEYTLSVQSLSPLSLLLVPNRADIRQIVESVGISFNADGVAEQVVLNEKKGGKTTIRFYNMELNKPFAAREPRQP